MKPLTTSCYTFSDLIEGGFLYVDKTARIHRLVREPKGQYFLSRPRRFGKSLLLSTLKAIFQGRRELFRGLAIDSLPFEWKTHPVIHIDLGDRHASSAEQLEQALVSAIDEQAALHGASLIQAGAAARFRELVLALASGGRVVILIDEYDKPILGNADNIPVAREILKVLKAFYSVVKTTEPYQRFALLTGVSKFSKVSVFSDLNNLTDLTMEADAATLLGYTQEELEANFAEGIDAVAGKEGLSRPEALDAIREWYNGYRFHRSAPTVYNPVSVMRLFATGEFSNYWFETGTPTFLTRLMRERAFDVDAMLGQEITEAAFSTYDIERLDLLPLLVQTGYLTIAGSAREGMTTVYRLDYPNLEVRQAFSTYLLAEFSDIERSVTEGHLFRIVRNLRAGEVEPVMRDLRVFFANIPYDIQLANEKYYQTIFHVIFTLVGLRMDCEIRTADGRIDAVAETADRVFIFEFKLNGTTEEALAQIREKRYFEKYLGRGKPVALVGAAFDPQTRNLERWLIADAD